MTTAIKAPVKRATMSEKNKAFWALPAAEKRIAVAKDVIKQLKAQRFIAQEGSFVSLPYNFTYNETEKFDQVFKKSKSTCHVCGIGACMLSVAHLGDKFTVAEVDDEREGYLKKMTRIFPAQQLLLIETAFEGYSFKKIKDVKAEEAAEDFYMNYRDSNDRLEAIMLNIVKNSGTFKP